MYAKKAVSLEPGNTEFIYDLAQVLAQMQRFKKRSTSPNVRARIRKTRSIARELTNLLSISRTLASSPATMRIKALCRNHKRYRKPRPNLRLRRRNPAKTCWTTRAKSPAW